MSQKNNLNPQADRLLEAASLPKIDWYMFQPQKTATSGPNWFDLARQALQNGELENTCYYVEEALGTIRATSDKEKLSVLLVFYGNLLLKLKNYDSALRVFAESVLLSPQPEVIYTKMGLICEKLGRLSEASSNFLQAIQLAPRDSEIRENFKRIEQQLNQHGKLTICMLSNLALNEFQSNIESAAALADEIILISPKKYNELNSQKLKTNFVILQREWQNDRSAALNEALEHATGDWILWLDANEQIPLGDQGVIRNLLSAEKNKAFYFHLYQTGSENQVWLQLRMFPNLPGIQFERPYYEDISQSAAKLNLHLVNSGVKLTQTHFAQQPPPEPSVIIDQLAEWITWHPDDFFARFVLGLTHYQVQHFRTAIFHFDQLIENSNCEKKAHTIFLNALIFKAKALVETKQFKVAIELLEKAQKIDERCYLIFLTLAEVYTELKNPEKAINYLKKCTGIPLKASLVPNNLVKLQGMWYFLMGLNWKTLKKFDQAILHFKKANIFLPCFQQLLRAWAQCYRALEKYQDALALMESAQLLDANEPENHIEMGYLYFEMNNLSQAQKYFNHAIKLNSESTAALHGLAKVYQISGENNQAIQVLKRITRINPNDTETWIKLGYLYLKQDQIGPAESALLTAQKKNKLPLNASLALIYLHARNKQFSRMLLGYRDILKALNSSYSMQPVSLKNLNQPSKMANEFRNMAIHLISKENPEGACFSLLTAVQLAPEQHKTSAMLAEVYYNQNDFTNAIHILEKLVLKEPRNSAYLRKLGDCYLKMKIDNAAKMCYWRARELENLKNAGSQRMAMDG